MHYGKERGVISRRLDNGARQPQGAVGSCCGATRNNFVAGWSSPVARQAHNLKVASSNLVPATKVSGCSAVGSARDLESRGRRFEPCHLDQKFFTQGKLRMKNILFAAAMLAFASTGASPS